MKTKLNDYYIFVLYLCYEGLRNVNLIILSSLTVLSIALKTNISKTKPS